MDEWKLITTDSELKFKTHFVLVLCWDVIGNKIANPLNPVHLFVNHRFTLYPNPKHL